MTMKMISDKDRQQAETTGLVTARDLRRVSGGHSRWSFLEL